MYDVAHAYQKGSFIPNCGRGICLIHIKQPKNAWVHAIFPQNTGIYVSIKHRHIRFNKTQTYTRGHRWTAESWRGVVMTHRRFEWSDLFFSSTKEACKTRALFHKKPSDSKSRWIVVNCLISQKHSESGAYLFVTVTWLIGVCGMAYWSRRYSSLVCDMAHWTQWHSSLVWNGSLVYYMTHWCVWHSRSTWG